MSVTNGQQASATNFNNAFMSRTTDTDTVGVVGLNNTSDPNSGNQIVNTQRLVNEIADSDGTVGEGDATRKQYSSTEFIANGDSRKVAIGKLDAQLDTTNTVALGAAADADDLRTLTGTADGTTDLGTFTGSTISNNTTIKNALQELETEVELKIDSAEKGAPNGVATLDGAGKIPTSQIPASFTQFLGNWDASTNTPTLTNGTGDQGDIYRANVAGTVNFGAGNITFTVGDWVYYTGTTWERSDNVDAVISVNGFSGVVSLDTDDIPEGTTNEYYTNAKVDARIGLASIDDLADVDTTTTPPNNNDVLTWTGANWEPAPAAASGANTALSNLAAVAINTDLVFDTGAGAVVKTKDDTGVSSQPIQLSSGNVTGAGFGIDSGTASLITGDVVDGVSGDANMITGAASGTGNTGSVVLTTGNSANGDSGDINLTIGTAGLGQGDFRFLKTGVPSVQGQVWTATDTAGTGYWANPTGGGGTGINYITNGHAEIDGSGWAAYADSALAEPQDGTGGTPNISFVQTTVASEILYGSASFKFSKPIGSHLGQGVSYDFSIDRADFETANEQFVRMSFRTSANYVSGDMKMFIYDVDAAVLIPLVNGESGAIQSSTLAGEYVAAWFPVNSTSENFRLIFHVATASALAYDLFFDNVVVGPSPDVPGAIVQKFDSLAFTSSWTTNTTLTARGTRIGNMLFAHIKLALSGAPNATGLSLTAPSNVPVDTTQINSPATAASMWGWGIALDNGILSYEIAPRRDGTANAWTIVNKTASGTNISHSTVVDQAAPFTFGAGDEINIHLAYPVAGWQASAVLSGVETVLQTPAPSAATSSTLTPTGSSIWHQFTGNSLTLAPGKYRLSGTIGFGAVAATGYSAFQYLWGSANGNNTGTTPALISAASGATVYGPQSSNVTQISTDNYKEIVPDLIVDLKQTTTIYLNAYSTQTTSANARIVATLLAQKLPDFSIFASYAGLQLPTLTLLTSGSGTFVPKASTKWMRVRLVGGGGGGGGVSNQSNGGSACGGGGGGYVEHIYSSITPGNTFAYAVGAAGNGAAAGNNNGSAGGVTTFGALTANNGSGGFGYGNNSVGPVFCTGHSSGGSASGGNVANIPGGFGLPAFIFSSTQTKGSNGGDTPLGVGGLAGQGAANGIVGQGYGAGGGGASTTNSTGAFAGGSGTAGVIIIEEYGPT